MEGMFTTTVENDMKKLKAYLEIIKKDSALKDAFLKHQRHQLQQLSTPYYQWLQATDGDRQANMHYYLPNGTSFLRMHQPDKFEDSLKGIRPMVTAVHNIHVAQNGFELGKYGLYLHMVEPLFEEKQYIGAIGLGTNIGSLLDDLKRVSGGKYVIALKNACKCREHLKAYKKLDFHDFKWIGDDLIIGKLPENYFDSINLESKKEFDIVELNGKRVLINRSMQMSNFQNDTVAKLISFHDISEMYSNYNQYIMLIIAMGITAILIILLSFPRIEE